MVRRLLLIPVLKALAAMQILAASGVASFRSPPPRGLRCVVPARLSRPPPSVVAAIPRHPLGEEARHHHHVQPSPSAATTMTIGKWNRRRSSHAAMALFAQDEPATENNDDDGDGEEKEKEKELTPETIAEMIEVSFLNSCLQLSQGYIDVLKLFIVAVKAGYEIGLPLDELHELVLECPVNSAGRELMKEEKALRREWMGVVYEMLDAVNSGPPSSADSAGSGRNDDDDDDNAKSSRISGVVCAMLDVRAELQRKEAKTGGEQDASVALLTGLTVERALELSPSLTRLDEYTTDPMERAFLTNDIRVALVTFKVLEEERICMQDSSGRTITTGGADEGKQVPRPPIPGT